MQDVRPDTVFTRELFSRLVFDILCGNTDDHARNHDRIMTGSQGHTEVPLIFEALQEFIARHTAEGGTRVT
jgi:hypothetical protein